MGWWSDSKEELREVPYDAEKASLRKENVDLRKKVKALEKENKELKAQLLSKK